MTLSTEDYQCIKTIPFRIKTVLENPDSTMDPHSLTLHNVKNKIPRIRSSMRKFSFNGWYKIPNNFLEHLCMTNKLSILEIIVMSIRDLTIDFHLLLIAGLAEKEPTNEEYFMNHTTLPTSSMINYLLSNHNKLFHCVESIIRPMENPRSFMEEEQKRYGRYLHAIRCFPQVKSYEKFKHHRCRQRS